MVLALYDFRSKQEFIYNTSKIKEISGASTLLSSLYRKFSTILNDNGFSFVYDIEKPFDISAFSSDAEVLYDGGGNFMVVYKDKETFIKANKIISVYLLENCPTLSLVACCVECTGNFEEDRRKLYAENALSKNRYASSAIANVTPITQIDPMTFAPVTYKSSSGVYYIGEVSLSADRLAKVKAYDRQQSNIESLDDTGLSAVIFIDGNSMGNKLISLSDSDYNIGVANLREFSKRVQNVYVDAPIKSIKDKGFAFRRIIGGGDEITLICKAKDALKIVETYFESLCSQNNTCVLPESCKSKFVEKYGEDALANTACAGIAVVHAKTPFTVAYELADDACESAKDKAHAEPGNYFDFYYCHAGATADFEILREREQSITGRPYAYSDIKDKFEVYKPLLQSAGRSNVKTLGSAAQTSPTEYRFEVQRINAYLRKWVDSDVCAKQFSNDPDEMKLVYDMSEFYDLWFNKGGNGDE